MTGRDAGMCHGGGLWGGAGEHRDDVRNKTTIKRTCSSLTAKPREWDVGIWHSQEAQGGSR
jgi:hypothetical protein